MERHPDRLDSSVTAPVRRARLADAAELADLCTQLGYPASIAEVNQRLPALLGSSDHHIMVAVDATDRAVGFIHAAIRRQIESALFVHIVVLVVSEAARGSGAGLKLLTDVETWSRGAGIRQVRVNSNIVRERAHSFYLRAGYTQAKTSLSFTKQLD